MTEASKSLSIWFIAERHALMGFIYGMVRDLGVAEDIFQEVWIRLAEAAGQGERIANPAAWCRGVAKNLILHHWRERRVAKVLADSDLLDLVEQALNEHADDWSDRRQSLLECMNRLPDKARELLHLKYTEGLSFLQMAARLGKSVDGLKMALSRVRRALAECVEKKLQLSELQP
ncbi:MAG: RNA polymerase sigma factor [Gemmataceae bacterium]